MRTIRPLMLLGLLASLVTAGCSIGKPDDHHEGEATAHQEHSPGEAHGAEEEHGHGGHGHGGRSAEGNVVELAPEAVDRIGLATTPVLEQVLATHRITTGQIGFDEERLAHVSPRVGGRLVRVLATLGATVAPAELLAVVDSMELGEAKAAFLRAHAHYEVAARRFERERDLSADGITSEQEAMEAEAEARAAAADLAVSRETLRLLGSEQETIENLRWDDAESSLAPLRAPFAGKIVERDATQGELVSVEDVLFTLADLSEVWLWLDLYERDLAHVRVGEPVEVRLDAWPEEILNGEVAYIADRLATDSRTVRARVDLPNPTRRLKPGMFARVKLETQEEQPAQALAVPRVAVQRDDETSVIFVQIAPGRYEQREVEIGRVSNDLVEILAGVSPGEHVVTEGAFLLKSQAAGDEIGGHHH